MANVLMKCGEPSRGDSRNHPDFMFFCPGCKCGHGVWTTKRNGIGAVWEFNGNMEKPTISPSILIHERKHAFPKDDGSLEYRDFPRCHSFVRDGMIQFLDDSTHALKGQTIALQPF